MRRVGSPSTGSEKSGRRLPDQRRGDGGAVGAAAEVHARTQQRGEHDEREQRQQSFHGVSFRPMLDCLKRRSKSTVSAPEAISSAPSQMQRMKGFTYRRRAQPPRSSSGSPSAT
jgi:hypothetical protein